MLIHESSHSRSTISVRIIVKQEILLWNVNQFMFHRLRSFIGTRQMSGKAGCSLSSWSTIWQGLARSVRDVCLSSKYSILNTLLSIQFSWEKWYQIWIWNKNVYIYSLLTNLMVTWIQHTYAICRYYLSTCTSACWSRPTCSWRATDISRTSGIKQTTVSKDTAR